MPVVEYFCREVAGFLRGRQTDEPFGLEVLGLILSHVTEQFESRSARTTHRTRAQRRERCVTVQIVDFVACR